MGTEKALGEIQYNEFKHFHDKNTQQPKNRRNFFNLTKGTYL